MEKKEKKPLTATQKKNRYRTLQYVAIGGEYLSILTPYIILGAVHYQEWFVNNTDSWRIGLGGSLALALMGIATTLITKKKEDTKITDGYISLIICWFAVSFVFVLLRDIMNQIAGIMLYGGLGLLGAFGLDLVSKSYKKKADMYKEAFDKVRGETIEEEIKKNIEEEVKKETSNKKKIAID